MKRYFCLMTMAWLMVLTGITAQEVRMLQTDVPQRPLAMLLAGGMSMEKKLFLNDANDNNLNKYCL